MKLNVAVLTFGLAGVLAVATAEGDGLLLPEGIIPLRRGLKEKKAKEADKKEKNTKEREKQVKEKQTKNRGPVLSEELQNRVNHDTSIPLGQPVDIAAHVNGAFNKAAGGLCTDDIPDSEMKPEFTLVAPKAYPNKVVVQASETCSNSCVCRRFVGAAKEIGSLCCTRDWSEDQYKVGGWNDDDDDGDGGGSRNRNLRRALPVKPGICWALERGPKKDPGPGGQPTVTPAILKGCMKVSRAIPTDGGGVNVGGSLRDEDEGGNRLFF